MASESELAYAEFNMDIMHWSIIVATALFGVVVMQGWTYFNNNNDRWYLRLFVAVLLVLDLAITCLNAIALRHYLILNTGTSLGLVRAAMSVEVESILTAVVVFLVQLFLASRVYLLGCSWYIPAIISGCAIGALASWVLMIADTIAHNMVLYLASTRIKTEMALSTTFALIADAIVTIALCWRFSTSGTSVKRMQNVLRQLFLQFITRGILITIFQFAHILVYELKPVSLHWMPFHILKCKLYVSTILAILNNRISLRTQMDMDAVDTSKYMPPILFDEASQSSDVESQTRHDS